MAIDRLLKPLGASVLLGLAGCASHPERLAATPPPTAQPMTTAAPMPQPPAGSAATMTVPARLADGSYATPNRGLAADAGVWHVRVALNVAALGCRGATGDTITAGYNALLVQQKAALAAAHDRVLAAAGGQDGYDEAMTRLYNFFAQPGAQADFCAAAAQVIAETNGGASLTSIAPASLAALDQPFQAFYRRFDAYRAQLAAWQADRLHRALQPVDATPQVAFAAAAPVPVAEPAAARRAPHLTVDPSIFHQP